MKKMAGNRLGILVKVSPVPKTIKVAWLSYHLAHIQGGSTLVQVDDAGQYYNAIYEFFDRKAGEQVIEMFDQKFLFGAKLRFEKILDTQQPLSDPWSDNLNNNHIRYWDSVPSNHFHWDVYSKAGQIKQPWLPGNFQGLQMNSIQRQDAIRKQMAFENEPLHWSQIPSLSKPLFPSIHKQQTVSRNCSPLPKPLTRPEFEVPSRGSIAMEGIVKKPVANEIEKISSTDNKAGQVSDVLPKKYNASELQGKNRASRKLSSKVPKNEGNSGKVKNTKDPDETPTTDKTNTYAAKACEEFVSDIVESQSNNVFQENTGAKDRAPIKICGTDVIRRTNEVSGSPTTTNFSTIRDPVSFLEKRSSQLMINRVMQSEICSSVSKTESSKKSYVLQEWEKNRSPQDRRDLEALRSKIADNQQGSINGCDPSEQNETDSAIENVLNVTSIAEIQVPTCKRACRNLQKKSNKKKQTANAMVARNQARRKIRLRKATRKMERMFNRDSETICKVIKLVARKLPDQEQRLVHAMREILIEMSDEVLMACEKLNEMRKERLMARQSHNRS